MLPYNRRTWLNSLNSDSTGSVVAFCGKVTYGGEQIDDAFLEIADCRSKVRLHLTSDDSIQDFLNKMKLLRNEIERFVNHLENKKMKITEFKKGDMITRVKVSEEYSSEPKHEFDAFIFDEICNGRTWLIHFNEYKGYKPEIFSEIFEKRKDDDWEYYTIPDVLRNLLLEQMGKSDFQLCHLLREHLINNYTNPNCIAIHDRQLLLKFSKRLSEQNPVIHPSEEVRAKIVDDFLAQP